MVQVNNISQGMWVLFMILGYTFSILVAVMILFLEKVSGRRMKWVTKILARHTKGKLMP
jgi:hypothetical protein